jgi:eukaryotic-like serine/threonine-protein kinase
MNDSITSFNELNRLWAAETIPVLSDVDSCLARLEPSELTMLLQQDQRNRWSRGCGIPVEEYVKQFANRIDESAQLDLIYNEFLLREDAGDEPLLPEYATRFPDMADSVTRQLELHAAMTQMPEGSTADVAAAIYSTEPAASSVPGLEGFEVHDVLGRGAMGVVYRATELSLHRAVAVKMLLSGRHSSQHEIARLESEAKAVARLRHPNIVAIHQVGTADGMPFLVMELIEGQTLADLLRDGPLPITQAVTLTVTICAAVHFANSQSVIHRDLKPSNVLIDQDLRPYVTDFGLARVVDEAPTETGYVVGTPQYMAPEQARGDRIEVASDVYSIGVILYEMLSGRPPFQAATCWDVVSQVLENDPPRLHDLNPSVPLDLQTVVEKCLEKTPSRRYASAELLADELKRIQSGRPVLARPVGPAQRLVKWCRRHPTRAALASAVGIIAVGVVVGPLVLAAQLSASNVAIKRSEVRARTAERLAQADRQAAVESFNNLVEDLYNDLNSQTGTIRGREAIISNALDGLKRISDRSRGRDVDRNLALAYLRSGDLRVLSGESEEALQNYELAVQTATEVAEEHPGNRGVLLTLSQCHEALALYYYRYGDTAQGLAAIAESIRVLQELCENGSGDDLPLVRLVSAYNRRNDVYWGANDLTGQLAACEEALPFVERLFVGASSKPSALTAASGFHQRFGRVLYSRAEYAEAAVHYERSAELAEFAVDLRPADDNLRGARWTALRLLANCQVVLDQADEAVALLKLVVDGTQQLSDEDSGSSLRLGEATASLIALAEAQHVVGDLANAWASFQRARQLELALLQKNPADQLARMGYCQCCVEMAMYPVLLQRDWNATADVLMDFRRVSGGGGDIQALDANVIPVQLMLVELMEEPVLRRAGRWSKPTSDNGTVVLVALSTCLAASDDASELTLDPDVVTLIPDGFQNDWASVFEFCRSLSLNPLPAAWVLNLEAITYGVIAQEAESRGDAELRESSLQLSLNAIASIRTRYPLFAEPFVDRDPQLRWVRSTAEYANADTDPPGKTVNP